MTKRSSSTQRPDWTKYELVVGTRMDITHNGIKRVCRDCGHDVFTSQPYPRDVAILCERCFQALPDDHLGPLPIDPDQLTDGQLARLCDKHGIRGDTSLSALQVEAHRRGMDLHTLVREQLIAQLKEAGVL